jgi:outer membrane murein-binding lipoprotein Lpp
LQHARPATRQLREIEKAYLVNRETETDRKVRLWEQHGQTLLMGLMTLGSAYMGNALVDSKTAQAATVVELKTLTTNVARLEGVVTAMQQQYATRAEFAVHEQRIQALEAKR